MKHKTTNKQAKLNVWTKRTHTGLSAPWIYLVFEHIVASNLSEMLWEVIPHFSSSGAERPSAVSVCSLGPISKGDIFKF